MNVITITHPKDILISDLMEDCVFYSMFDKDTREMLNDFNKEFNVFELFKFCNRNYLEEKALILRYFGVTKKHIDDKICLPFCEKILTYINDEWFDYVHTVLHGNKNLAKYGNNKSRFIDFSLSLKNDDDFWYLGYGEKIIFNHFYNVARNIKMPCQLKPNNELNNINSEWCDYAVNKSAKSVKHFNALLDNILVNIEKQETHIGILK